MVPKGYPVRLDSCVEQGILDAYLAGITATDSGRLFGVGRKAVARLLARRGVTRRHNFRSPALTLPSDAAAVGYLAGLIDGEGSIITPSNGHIYVCITNTDSRLIGYLAAMGGCVTWNKVRSANHTPCAVWRVARRVDAYRLLRAVEPYLIVKRAKARAALDVVRSIFEGFNA